MRGQMVDAVEAFADPSTGRRQPGGRAPARRRPDERRAASPQRLRDALADFDAATIATTHQFCQLVLQIAWRGRGHRRRRDAGREPRRAGRPRSSTTSTWPHFGQRARRPGAHPRDALQLAREVVGNPATRAAAARPGPGLAGRRPRRASPKDVLAELETRKRRLRHPGLRRPAEPAGRRAGHRRLPARRRGCASAGRIVMVDEFQDTDPVQWQVIDRAFSGRSTRDPDRRPEAGDLRLPRRRHRHLPARPPRPRVSAGRWAPTGAATPRCVRRGCRWCCAAPQLGDADDRGARRRRAPPRLTGSPAPRTTTRSGCGWSQRETFGRSGDSEPCRSTSCATHIGADLAADIGALLASGATFDGRAAAGPRHRGDRREAPDAARLLASALRRRASPRCTPATPTCSPPRPPRTGCACWRRSTNRTGPGMVRAAARDDVLRRDAPKPGRPAATR